ncbi:MAG: CTP synthase, partial [Granulosicoccus sp.]
QQLDELVVEQFRVDLPAADLSEWQRVVDRIRQPGKSVTIGMVGKYTELTESYKSLNEALTHAGIQTDSRVKIRYLDAEKLERGELRALSEIDAILVPGGFGNRGVEGKIIAARYARENNIPYLGICLGMQVAVIEYARHVAGIDQANSSEFDLTTSEPVIALITEWQTDSGETVLRTRDSDMGGTMRLGGQLCVMQADSLASRTYGAEQIVERHRHRFEFNDHYANRLLEAGLVISARASGPSVMQGARAGQEGTAASNDAKGLVEMIELPNHPWFIGCQFHPEYTSNPRDGHPLFTGLISAALEYQQARLSRESTPHEASDAALQTDS